jgi:7,8-dihydropterin-6-yl-methyl-4-(beta-D-ribofuranosyl)aminobenzene 5'-phosphate synthase
MFIVVIWLGFILLLVTLVVVKKSMEFIKDKKRADKEWNAAKPEKISNLGSVKNLTILPLVDWYTADKTLSGEGGVAYLVRSDKNSILMDTGNNTKKEVESPLLCNMKALGVSLEEIKSIFISHLHMDHVGGLNAQKSKTVKLGEKDIDLTHTTIYVPTEMTHTTAKVRQIEKPEVLMPGMASEGPIGRSIFGLGYTKEQALVINVEGKGLVLIVGCGHQGLKRIIERAEAAFSEPIYGLVGGLHYPVTQSRLKLLGLPMQKYIGTGKFPWQNVTRSEVRNSIVYLKSKNLKLISISAHDSCDWALNEFKNECKDVYQELKVGAPITVNTC